MPLYLDDFINLLAEICKIRGLKCSVKSSLKGGLITGISAAFGGLLLGPIGLALGGAIGGTAAAVSSSGQFQSAAVILLNLSQEQKIILYQKFLHAFREFGPQDAAALVALLMSQRSLQSVAINEIRNYLTNDMGLQIV